MASRRRFDAIIPAKSFLTAKSRLSSLLSLDERELLSRTMLQDVLQACRDATCIGEIYVVTADATVSALAETSGARVVAEQREVGTDAAVRAGLCALGPSAEAALIFPSDIPDLTAAIVDRIAALTCRYGAVVVPAIRDGGTNALGLIPPDLFATGFGQDSCAKHLAAARLRGVEPHLLQIPGIGRDLDTADDVLAFIEKPRPTRTRLLLKRLGLPSRAVKA